MCFQIYGMSTAMARLQYYERLDGRPTILHLRYGLRRETKIVFVSAEVLPTSLPMLLFQLVCLLPLCHIHFSDVGTSPCSVPTLNPTEPPTVTANPH